MTRCRSLPVCTLLLALAVAAPAAAASPLDVALEHLAANHDRLGLTLEDLADKTVTDQYRSAHNGVTHVYFRQRLRGLTVANATLNVNVGVQGDVVSVGNKFVRGLAAKANRSAPVLDAGAAIVAAAKALGLAQPNNLVELESASGASRAQRFSGAGVSLDAIPVKLAYYATPDAAVILSWEMVLREPNGEHWWNLWIDAESGELLAKVDWIANDNTYQVFAYPQESPDDGPRTIPPNPADTMASPFGWHDTNGIAGAEFFDTRGNNVTAQEDRDGNNSGGFRPSGGSTLDFLSPLDLATQSPGDYQAAAVTNLFYWNNILHDLLYQYGFNEPAGNFQSNNYGHGGMANDPVIADAQDGSGTDNANFATPVDGSSPRMQMFEWTSPKYEVLAAGATYVAAPALSGPGLNTTGVSGLFVAAQDATESFTDGCEPLTNPAQVNGGIAIVDRGTCTFVTKMKNAQNAGAVALVVVNGTDDVLTMGGIDGSITIPSLMIGKSAGDAIRNALPVSGTLRLSPNPLPNRDSDLDAGVIAHEYCHGLSVRLTGGPGTNCLGGDQQAGEGWSDLCTLFFTASPTDTATTPRGVGNYVMFQPSTGPGIRPYPYTVDMSVNPLTYGALLTAGQSGGLTIPHGVGTVWATAVWEMYWNLVGQYGFSTDFYSGNGGNNVAIQLVVDGLKMQPCYPTFLDARDAILAADQADYSGTNRCLIWEAFAKRGMGVNAYDGGSGISLNVVEDFTVPADCLQTTGCGNGVCETGETCTTCANDCPGGTTSGAACGNGVCEAGNGEDCVSCPQDCNGKLGGKPNGRFCCGSSAGAGTVTCSDSRCSQNGLSCEAAPTPPGNSFCCGNGICENGETCGTCGSDCPAGQEVCSGGADEDCDGLVDCADPDCSTATECEVPVCTLGSTGDPCTGDQDCCSGSCKGKPDRKTCR